MADNAMLSIFDTDGGFLDDLASDNGLASSGNLMDAGGLLGQNTTIQMNPPIMNTQPQMFNQQIGGIPPNQFGNIPMQPPNLPQQNQFMSNTFGQNQFNTTKLHHFGGAVQQQPQQPGNGTHIMVLQQNSQPRPQQQPQIQVVGGNMQPSSGFKNYGGVTTTQGPRLPNPHQQIGMQQNMPRIWNQNGPNQSSFVQQQMPNQQSHLPVQNMPQQQMQSGNSLQATYLTHHDYALPKDNNVPQNCYQDNMTSTPNANAFMQGMKSPPSNMRPNVPTLSSPNSNLGSNVSNIGPSPRPQQQMIINRNGPFQPPQNINTVNMPNFNASQQQTFQNNFSIPNVQNVGQMNSSGVSVPNSSFPAFTYQQQLPNQNSMGSGIQMSQNVNDKSSNIIPFQNTSPNQNVQFRPGYTAGTPQRTITPSASPRPIPSPAGTPDQNAHTSPNSQGNNQLVSPTLVSRNNVPPASSPYHQAGRSDANVPASQPQIPVNSFGNVNNSNNVSINNNQSNIVPNQQITVSVSQPNISNIGQMSPNVGQVKNVNVEIYQLQQQIQLLHNQPQTQQTQQQMLDLQERVRTLRAQQELNNQRQKVQQTQQFPPYQVNHQQIQQQTPQRPAIIQVQQQTMQPRQQIVQIQQSFPNQQIQQPNQQGQKILLLSNSMPGQPQRFFQTVTQSQGQQFGQQPQQQKVLLIQQQQTQPGQQIRLVTQGQPQQIPTQLPPSSMAVNNASVPMSVVQIQLPQKTETVQQTLLPKIDSDGEDKSVQKVKAQEKANQIVAEAVAKAQAAGNLQIPKVVTPPPIPSTVGDADVPGSEEEGKKKSAKKRTKKRVPKTPKEKKVIDEDDGESSEKKQKVEKPKSVKKKRKPPATFLKSKKRKRNGSSDGSDVEIKITPPPSPENDEDGIQKRRSARNTKRKKYHDEVDLNLSEEDADVDADIAAVAAASTGGAVLKPVQYISVDNTPAPPPEEEIVVVEKILGVRMRKLDKDIDVVNEEEEEAQPEEEVEEFFVKFKNYSYLHCEWKTIAELEKDKRIHMKIKRFRQKRDHAICFDTLDEDELFNPDYVEVDRVLELSVTTDPVTSEDVTHFLVKWRGLPYEDSTWELQQDVDPEKVKLFYKYKDPPPENERQVISRPSRDDWKKLPESKVYKGGNNLRDYQLEGVNWLTFNWYKHQNCILADEMGLGKTIQSIAFLHEIVQYGIVGPFLVVVPLSTLGNWQREFETWTDINTIVYHGSNASKFMLQEYEMFYKDESGRRIADVYKFRVLVTTFEIIISDCELLSSVDWRCLIIDEAHRLKNKNCKLMEGLRFVDCEHRVLLTGTPLQNNVEELFSLLNFLEPEQFNSSQAFLTEFGNLKTDEQVDKLKALLKPMMLRRLKEDVEKNLAAKEETIIEVELTNIQKKYYRAILERNFAFLSKGSTTSANVPNLLNTMMELRKCCNHPYLVKGAEDMIIRETKEKEQKSELDIFDIHKLMVQSSGKLVLLDKLLPKLKQNGHKVLVFSQMIKVLDILEDYLIHRRYLYERLDGRITGIMRQEAIDRFSKPDSDRFVFLLCTRAGGLGINLTAADTVIIYDSDWNPQNDLQAQARCHRIGQSKAVKVYRLITRNSYEREMFDRASMKLGLDKAVLQSMGGEKNVNPQQQMTKKEIEELLRKGAYGALMEDDKAGDDFCEEDIDQILQRRTQVIQIESEGKGSTFAKASFTMSENRSDIDINDPNFWQKWAKKADVDIDQDKNQLIVEMPRMRKQTARYGNDDGVMDMSELESSTDEEGGEEDDEGSGRGRGRGRKGKKGKRKGRGSDDDFDAHGAIGELYSRSECFKVEKNLLVFGWGRWSDIISHGRFKRTLIIKDVETISRALLMYSLKVYKGDEKIKEFIWDLISPSNDGSLRNHSGLSAPVPRGRKGKNKMNKKEQKESEHEMAMAKFDIDPETILKDQGYRRHLHRHANKVLLRVRLLYYLREEIIGNAADKINKGLDVSEIELPRANVEGEPPTLWWDELSDRSLLIGVFKHGYEKYNLMRSDHLLCFLSRCGPPDGAALAAEQNDDDDEDMDDPKPNASILKDDMDEDTCTSVISSQDSTAAKETPVPMATEGDDEEKLPWPTMSDLNTRLRRIITSFQRNHKRQMLKDAQRAKRMEKRERYDMMSRYKEDEKIQYQQSHWTRREESDFYRIISTFGVEFDLYTGRYKWDRFRTLARLEKKHDDTLTEYFQAFYHMCMRVCKKFKNDDDALPPNNIYVEPISEERASRSLARIDILNKIRTETLAHPKFDERVKLCQTSYDLPSWWICGKHDKDLLRGAARHGVVRTDEFILNDPALSFKDVFRNKRPFVNSPHFMQSPGASQTPSKFKNKEEETELEIKAMIEKIKRESQKDKSEVCSKDVKKEQESPNKQSDDSINEVKKENKEGSPDSKKDISMETEFEVKVESESNIKEEVKSELIDEVKKEINESLVDEERVVDDDEEATDIEHDVSDSEMSKETEEVSKETEVKVENQEESEISPKKIKLEEEEIEVKVESSDDMKKETDDVKKEVDKVKAEEGEKFSREDVELQKLINAEDNLEDKSSNIPSDFLQWPKDRVIFHRLEHICYCVETGEWPFPKRMSCIPMSYDSRSATPLGSTTPRDDQDLSQSDAGDSVYDGIKGDGLKMTFHKRKEQKMEGRMAHLLNQSAASSDNESPSESLTPRSQVAGHSPRHSPHHYFFSQTPADLLSNGSGADFDPVLLQRSMMEHALMFPDRPRRGRKRKAEKMAELAMAEALARRHQAKTMSAFDPESRVPVINLEDGSRLSGDEAPQKKDLEKWLDEHPGFMVADCDEEDLYDDMPRRGRKPRLDPSMIDPIKMTGDENVSVVNRITGKKITGAKAPPLKYLTEWLEQNPLYDVDSKWADIVRSKMSLPKSLQGRVMTPSRGRKPKDSLSSSLMGSDIPFSAASLSGLSGFPNPSLMSGLSKLPLGMPFGALPNFGLGNPLLGMAGYLPGLTTHSKDLESSSKESKSPKSKESSKSESKSPSLPHPSFPFMYNPMLLNPLFAAQAQSLGFSLPTSLPTSFGALAHSGMVNGSTGDSDLEEGEIKRYSQKDRRSRSGGLQDAPQDLTVKSKHHHDSGRHHHSDKKHVSHSSKHDKMNASSVSKHFSASRIQEEPTDLSMKTKPGTSESSKSKPKIQSSFKLSKIVDSLKDKVNKMEDRSKKDKKSKLDSILNKLVEEKEIVGVDRQSVDDDSSTTCAADLSITSDSKGDDIGTEDDKSEMS